MHLLAADGLAPAVEKVEALVVGAGQAGVAMSEHLSRAGIPHLVLERDRIAERWRTGRWDSLVANGPAWHDRFPGLEFAGTIPTPSRRRRRSRTISSPTRGKFDAPIRCGVEVTEVRRNDGRPGFRVETSDGVIEADHVIAATGPFQRPVLPGFVPEGAGITQMHSAAYRNPGQLPEGAVLVVGAGASGAQIAEELLRAGRRVFISIGPHDRPPRRYRGRDNVWWLGVLNKWDAEAPPAHEARHLRGQRRLWRRNRRLPASRGAGHDAARPGRVLRGRRDDLRAGARGEPRDGATGTISRCSTRPTPRSPATASTCPRSRRPARSRPTRTA